MLNVTCYNYRFVASWRKTLLTLLVIIGFIYLGVWQLQRAEEKKAMLAANAGLSNKPPITWEAGMANPQQYHSLIVQGHYLPQVILLDNQHHHHQFGYHVLIPIQLERGNVILIDKGWVRGNNNRQKLPAIISHQKVSQIKPIQLSGYVYYPSNRNLMLGQVLEKKTTNLAIVEWIDTQLISQFLHKSVYPFIIRQDKAQIDDGYVHEWAIVSIPPERHSAYALQWFAMAFVSLVIFIGVNRHKIDKNYET